MRNSILSWANTFFHASEDLMLTFGEGFLSQSKLIMEMRNRKRTFLFTLGPSPWETGLGQVAWGRATLSSVHSTCSSSCRSRWSWDSSCLLWSSKICILASSLPLCCLRSFASAISSESSDVWWGDTTESGGEPTGSPLLRCWSFSCSYSTCKFLT